MIYLNRFVCVVAFLLVVTAPASSAEIGESFCEVNDIRVQLLSRARGGDEALVFVHG